MLEGEGMIMKKAALVLVLGVALLGLPQQAQALTPKQTLNGDMLAQTQVALTNLQSAFAAAGQYAMQASSFDPFATFVFQYTYYAQIYTQAAMMRIQMGDDSALTQQYLVAGFQFAYFGLYASYNSSAFYGIPNGNLNSITAYTFLLLAVIQLNNAMNTYNNGHDLGLW
jgi:hypothetical protein